MRASSSGCRARFGVWRSFREPTRPSSQFLGLLAVCARGELPTRAIGFSARRCPPPPSGTMTS
eukprot:11184826-Lingulodinium_polyedra.AAC.1